MYRDLRNALESTPRDKRQIGVILGFLSFTAESDPEFYATKLDEAVGDGLLGEWFPIIQRTSKIDQRGVKRLHESLDLGKAPIDTYQNIAWVRVHESISDDDMAGLIEKILTKEGGVGVAIEMLQIGFNRSNEDSREHSDALIAVAHKTLKMHPLDQKQRKHGSEDYPLSKIAQNCLGDTEGINVAKKLAKNLADAILTYQIYSFDYTMLLNTIAYLQPRIFLDEFLGREDMEEYHRDRLFSDEPDIHKNPMGQISDDAVIAWCEEESESRYSIVASAVEGFEKTSEAGKYEWRPIVNAILDRAPDVGKVLEALGRSLRPSSWSGSLANILEERSVLLRDLYDHQNVEVASWAKSYITRFQQNISSQREWEQKQDRPHNESFE